MNKDEESQTSKGDSIELQEAAPSPETTASSGRNKKRWFILTAFVILAVIGITLGVTLSRTSTEERSAVSNPQAPPAPQDDTDTTGTDTDTTPVIKPQKDTWPELVGMSITEAVSIIENERPDLTVKVLPWDALYTDDYVTTRVRVFQKDDKVHREPRIG